jgi:hypothetical protein
MLVKFTEVSHAEFGPFGWVMAEPSAQFSARRKLLEPEIDLGCIL